VGGLIRSVARAAVRPEVPDVARTFGRIELSEGDHVIVPISRRRVREAWAVRHDISRPLTFRSACYSE
jgi:hypothetical protein